MARNGDEIPARIPTIHFGPSQFHASVDNEARARAGVPRGRPKRRNGRRPGRRRNKSDPGGRTDGPHANDNLVRSIVSRPAGILRCSHSRWIAELSALLRVGAAVGRVARSGVALIYAADARCCFQAITDIFYRATRYYAQNPLDLFPRSFPVDGKGCQLVTDLLRGN